MKKNLLESLQNQKSPSKARFSRTSYKDFVLARSEFLRHIGAPNESLRLIIMYYTSNTHLGSKNFAGATSVPKKPFKGSI